jgi:hypothetical protein
MNLDRAENETIEGLHDIAAVNNGAREIVCHGLGKTVYNDRIRTLEAKDLATHNASYARGAKLLWAMMVEEVRV